MSNAPHHYMQGVLKYLGIRHHFTQVYGIEQLHYRPKPDQQAYWLVLQQLQRAPHQCVMVEDSRANLKMAKRLGMSTVWLSHKRAIPIEVDVRVDSIRTLVRQQSRVLGLNEI